MKAAQRSKTSWLGALLGSVSATVLAATAARAEVLVPFTPGDNLTPHVSVQHDENAGIWTYTYSVTNDGPQNAGLFAVEVGGDPEIIQSPFGWSPFWRPNTATDRTIIYWAATDVGTLPADFVWDGNIIPSPYAVMPGGPAKVFIIQSPYPPGPVRFWVQGETKMPQVTDESDLDQLPLDAFSKDFTEDSQQIDIANGGPVPPNTCGATNGIPCDDGYFCNGTDSCAGGACTQHAGDPCPIYDADTNCAGSCDELANSCTQPDPAGSPCDDSNPCSVEQCDGFGACRIEPGNAGVACGAPQGGDCQVERTCTGASIVCPSSSSAPAGTACSDDGNPCTVDQCDASGTCTHTAGNSGALCRAAQGACDVPEACSGTSASCPIDQLTAVGTVCRASSSICDPQETCSGSSTTCPADSFAASTVTCRTTAGICDVAEKCTGSSSSCPADGLLSSTNTCRASAGACDVQEKCTGTSASCPDDLLASAGAICRASSSICDPQETCTGSSASCPANVFASSTVTCRAAAGVCDVAEKCTGTSSTCPVDGRLPSTSTCRASAGVCDVQENCTGTSASCPIDLLASAGTVCRASSGICDSQETCTGSSAICPADTFFASTITCRAAAGVCDVAEKCTGMSSTCPVDGLLPSTSNCRASAGVCDVAERCSGTSAACPSDQFAGANLECRASQGECDEPETCSGSAATCPDNVGTICVPDCPPSPLNVPCDEFVKGELTLRTEAPEKKRLLFRGSNAPEIAIGELGNPQIQYDTTRYLFCAYNSGSLISRIAVDPQGSCQKTVSYTGQCWSPDPEHFGRLWYRDRSRDPQNGLSTVVFNAKRRLKVSVKGRGRDLQIIPTDLGSLTNSDSVEFQVIRTNGNQFAKCWHVDLPVPDKSTATRFTAKSN